MNEYTHRFEALKSGGLLPSPKGVALAVMEISGRDDGSIHDIVRLIQADPAMAGRILRYANAAHRGVQRKIVSVAQAITFLGLFRVRQIALGFSLIDQYRRGHCSAFDYQAYWTGALATAIAAQHLAGVAQCPADESFTCGLLSGVGKLALATAFPEQYSQILSRDLGAFDLAHEERQAFGIDNAELSAEMLAGWGLPEIFTTAVRTHQFLVETTFIPGSRAYALSSALHFAMKIGELLNHDESQRWQLVPTIFNAAAIAGVTEDEVPTLVSSVISQLEYWASDLSLPTKADSDMRSLLEAPPPQISAPDGGIQARMPRRVGVMQTDKQRTGRLTRRLDEIGIRAVEVHETENSTAQVDAEAPEICVIDLCELNEQVALTRLQQFRIRHGGGHHVIAFISDEMDACAPAILSAGAADYLSDNHTESALVARLANAQRLVTLQAVVRAERELAVSSSGEWGRANRRLQQEALTDPLTRLPNRRYGLDRFAQEWSIALSNNLPIACLMLDIDYFKRVNDERGHETGDIVLLQMAQRIQDGLRRNDVVFRYGGEEFCAMCPGTGHAEARQLAERLLEIVRAGHFGQEGQTFPLTVSIGISALAQGMTEFTDLIAQADQALYRAKHNGRNCVSER